MFWFGGEEKNQEKAPDVSSPISNGAGSIQNNVQLRRAASLRAAARTNNLKEMDRLVRLGLNLDITCDGWTAISTAAKLGNNKTIETLVKYGGSVDAGNQDGSTAVHAAAEVGHVETIRFLHELGANVDKANDNGVRPIIVAEENGQTEVITLLKSLDVDYYKGASAYVFAIQGKVDDLKALAGRGEDMHKPSSNGSTPALAAAQNGHMNTLKYLVSEHEADIFKTNDRGQTPLIMAIFGKHGTVVDYLRGVGANLGNEHMDITTADDILKWMQLTKLDFHVDEVSEGLIAWAADAESFLTASSVSQMHEMLGGDKALTIEWAGFWYNAATMHSVIQEDRKHTKEAIAIGMEALALVDNPVARREVGRIQREIFATYSKFVSKGFGQSSTPVKSGDLMSTLAPMLEDLQQLALAEHSRLASEATEKCLNKYMTLSERWQMAMSSMPYVPTSEDDEDAGPWVKVPLPKPSPRAIAHSVLVDLSEVPRPIQPPIELSWIATSGVADQCPIGTGPTPFAKSGDDLLLKRLTHLTMLSRCWSGMFGKIIGDLVARVNTAESPQTFELSSQRFLCPFISNRNLLVDGSLRAKFTASPLKSLEESFKDAKSYAAKMKKFPKAYPSKDPTGKPISSADYVTDIVSGVVDVENPYMVAILFEVLRDNTPGVQLAWCENNLVGNSSENLIHSAATIKLTLKGPETEAMHRKVGAALPFNPQLAGQEIITTTLRLHFTGFRHIEAMTGLYGKIAFAKREDLPSLILKDPVFINPSTLEDEIPAVIQGIPTSAVKAASPGKKMGKLLLNAHKRGDLEKIASELDSSN